MQIFTNKSILQLTNTYTIDMSSKQLDQTKQDQIEIVKIIKSHLQMIQIQVISIP